MLTDYFYQELATRIKFGSQPWGAFSIAIGTGQANWDSVPPVLRRGMTSLVNEVARKTVATDQIEYLDNTGQVSQRATAYLRLQTTFLAGEGAGAIRECGLWTGEGENDAGVMLAYFIHPRVEKQEDSVLQRRIVLDLIPGRPIAQENPTRYLGNSKSEELHDLENEQSLCQLDEIRIDRRHYFNSVAEAQTLGYDFCAYCFGREMSQR